MGDIYEAHAAMADVLRDDSIDVPDSFDIAGGPDATDDSPSAYYDRVLDKLRDSGMRPDAKRGRYYLPNPENGKSKGWQRVTNFVKLTDDTYHLELWKQRNIIKGLATMLGAPTEYGFRTGINDTIDHLSGLHVKQDKERLNNIALKAQDVAEAYKMADAGTLLHAATEVADYMGGDLSRVLPQHQHHVRLYRDALAVNGIIILPDLIERVTASDKYQVAGKFDRVCGLRDGSNVVVDLKTGDSIDLSFPSIAAQLDAYRDGVNSVGIFDGQRYDQGVKVRNDFAIVVHLPSTRDEVTVYAVDLAKGAIINAANLVVRDARKIKAPDVSSPFDEKAYGIEPLSQEEKDQHWLEQLNAAFTRDQLVDVAGRAKAFGQWNERLASQARLLAAEVAA